MHQENVAGLRDWFRFRDFDHFVEIYVACSSVLKAPEDFQQLVADFAVDQERENVRYTEVHFTVGTHWLGPCPPKGNAPQHYVMTIIATDLEPNALQAGLTKAELLKVLEGGKALRAASLSFRFWQ